MFNDDRNTDRISHDCGSLSFNQILDQLARINRKMTKVFATSAYVISFGQAESLLEEKRRGRENSGLQRCYETKKKPHARSVHSPLKRDLPGLF